MSAFGRAHQTIAWQFCQTRVEITWIMIMWAVASRNKINIYCCSCATSLELLTWTPTMALICHHNTQCVMLPTILADLIVSSLHQELLLAFGLNRQSAWDSRKLVVSFVCVLQHLGQNTGNKQHLVQIFFQLSHANGPWAKTLIKKTKPRILPFC